MNSTAHRHPEIRRSTSSPLIATFPAAFWKAKEGARTLFGKSATWTNAEVDRAAAGDGELGVYRGRRCIVARPVDASGHRADVQP